ncbi:MAG: hypothetical protein HC849_13305 [Oscillatoriales cyanobacterium RU_3_3]|nr:hypothetical protein [Microcoleus sp. SU_5_3]NJM60960.1 hypothetical protein [Oscillatoriales cyanobacterium RU_3_3]
MRITIIEEGSSASIGVTGSLKFDRYLTLPEICCITFCCRSWTLQILGKL